MFPPKTSATVCYQVDVRDHGVDGDARSSLIRIHVSYTHPPAVLLQPCYRFSTHFMGIAASNARGAGAATIPLPPHTSCASHAANAWATARAAFSVSGPHKHTRAGGGKPVLQFVATALVRVRSECFEAHPPVPVERLLARELSERV